MAKFDNVLLIEDDSITIMVCERIITMTGFASKVKSALNGKEANLGANARLAQAALIPTKELVTDAILRRADQFDDSVDVIQRLLQTFEDVRARFGLTQFILGSPADDIDTMLDEGAQQLQERQYLRLAVH